MSHITYAEAKKNNLEIISDKFENSLGKWFNYGTFDISQKNQLLNQTHVDIKSFYKTAYNPSYIIDLSSSTVDELQTLTTTNNAGVQIINANVISRPAESWSAGLITTVNGWRSLKFSCSTTLASTYSKNSPININSYATNSYILISWPNYPSVSATGSSVEFTTDTTATGFDVNQTDTVAFNAATVVITTTNGNTEMRVPTSLLTKVFASNNPNKGFITGVKFNIALSTGTGDFYCSSIRCVSNNWKYAPIDINTLEKTIVKTVPPNGALPTSTLSANLNSPVSISAATWSSNVITFTTSNNHGFVVGNSIKVSGVATTAYNGTYSVVGILAENQFTVSKTPDPGSAGGLGAAIAEPAIIQLADSSAFPNSGIILINNKEYIEYDGNNSNNLTVKTRGYYENNFDLHTTNSIVSLFNFNYPVNPFGSDNLPTKWPVLYRTFDELGISTNQDPNFVNGNIYGVINTGDSLGENSSLALPNTLNFYFRLADRLSNQAELNLKTQEELNNTPNILGIKTDTIFGTQAALSKIPGSKANLTLSAPLSGSYQKNSTNLEPSLGKNQSQYSRIPGSKANLNLPAPLSGSYQKGTGINQNGYSQYDLANLSAGENSIVNQISFLGTSFNWYKKSGVTSFTITAATWASNLITYTTSTDHKLKIGDEITVSNITPNTYNGVYIVNEIVSATSFKVLKTSNPNTATNFTNANFVTNDIEFKIKIFDELTTLFEFNFSSNLNYWRNKKFVVKSEINNKTIRCKLFELKNNQLELIYSTGKIDSLFVHDNKGRFGWFADFCDGETQLEDIYSNGITYSEYRSNIINSITPVKGAQIFANQTQEPELITELKSNPWTITTKSLKSVIKDKIKIYTIEDANTSIWQGVETNTFKIENFEDIYINFDIYFTSSTNKLIAFLYNKTLNQFVNIYVPDFNKNQWSKVRLTIRNDHALPGEYSLIFAEDGYNNNNAWSIKNVSVKKRLINWSMRSFVDAGKQIDDREWILNPLVNLIPNNQFTASTNKSDGLLFAKQDTELQIKAEAINPYVELRNFDVQPEYATLGNFTWENE